jgi:hypothetical protein
MWQVMGIDMSSTEVVVVVVARTVSKRHIKTTSDSLLHAREVALTALKHRINTTSSSLLHAREVEDVETASKCAKNPPPAHFCTRGRWRRKESTFGTIEMRGESRREVEEAEIHLQLAFAHEGGGRCRNGGKMR